MNRRAIAKRSSALSFAVFVPVVLVIVLCLATPSHAQNVPIDLSSTSALCGGQECFNVAGLFTTGTQFLGTSGMDNGNNCTPTAPYTNCPDAYSSTQLGLSSATPPTLTPPSLNVPFQFGTVNTTNCGPSTSTACTLDVVNFTSGGVQITLPAAQQVIYSTMIILGSAVNGHHTGDIVVTYTTGNPDTYVQGMSDWCGFSASTATEDGTSIGVTESIAVGSINRINSDGTLNGASCNLYGYTLPLDVTRDLQSITLKDGDGSGEEYALAITLKPPSYTIDGGAASPTSVGPGSSATATVTVNPQPGYSGNITLSCSILPTIIASGAATPPTCSLNPNSVTVTTTETAPPTTQLTFTAANPSSAKSARHGNIFYAFLLIPGMALVGLGFGSRDARRKRLLGLLLLAFLLTGVMTLPACVSYTHLGNVGTPPGAYTISVTGIDTNGLTQASNTAGTTNTVVVTVANQ